MTGFLLSLAFAFSGFLGPTLALSWGPQWAYLTVVLALGLIPFLDLILPRDRAGEVSGPSWFFDLILITYTGMHAFLLIWGAWLISQPEVSWELQIGLTLSVGLVTGAIGVTFAHELIHRSSRWQRSMGEFILVLVGYGHFAVAHVYGHHRHVATPEDPATARKGQSIYAFFLQAIPGVFTSSYQIKPKRTLAYVALTLAAALGLFGVGGGAAVAFFAGQALLAILLTEITDYIEHYGLQRMKLENGRYEPVAPHHSWDSDCWLSGKILIHLQRHSDHHTHASKKYQDLRLVNNPRQLPTGYAGCLLAVLIPPLWRKMMDHRLPS